MRIWKKLRDALRNDPCYDALELLGAAGFVLAALAFMIVLWCSIPWHFSR